MGRLAMPESIADPGDTRISSRRKADARLTVQHEAICLEIAGLTRR